MAEMLPQRNPVLAGAAAPLRARLVTALFWAVLIGFFWSLSTYVMWLDYDRRAIDVPIFRLVTNEATSAAAAYIMVPFLYHWLDRYPPGAPRPWLTAGLHAAGSVIFSLGHVGLMMLLRNLVYLTQGQIYRHAIPDRPFGLVEVLLYEYMKDLPVYLGFGLLIVGYRFFRSRHRSPLPMADGGMAPVPRGGQSRDSSTPTGRLLVRKGKADKALDIAQIDWLQSAANYVQVFAGGEEYLIRTTLNELQDRLDGKAFCRVHRQFMVNLHKISEITALENGSHRIDLISGAQIPLSRSYRDSLYQAMGG